MRIVCPSCAAVYDFADARLPASGRVRCAQCAQEWLAGPPGPPIAGPPIAGPPIAGPPIAGPPIETPPTETPPIETRRVEAPRVELPPQAAPPAAGHPGDAPQAREWPPAPRSGEPARRNRAAGAAWMASLLLVVLLAAGAYAYRAEIMRVWPPSARAYQLLGP